MNSLLLFLLCGLEGFIADEPHSPEVKVAGNWQQIMLHGDLSAQIDMDTLWHQNLFALGTMAGLQGEVTVINGRSLSTSVRNTYLRSDTTFKHKASMLVYTYVSKWKEVEVNTSVKDLEELQQVILQTAENHHINTNVPFPFMVKTWTKNVAFHVINWSDSTQHTFENHKMFAHELLETNTGVFLLGFYSNKHQGIFTAHNSQLHAHVVAMTHTPLITGHLDNIETMDNFTLYLPIK